MKKILLILLAVIAFGCKTQEKVVNTKLDNKTESLIKGNWILTQVSYAGSDYIKINAFGIAETKCFIGSQWSFTASNNQGSVNLDNSNCTSFTSPITWYINKDGNFVLKIINENKAKKVAEGYILQINNASNTQFDLIDQANVGGQKTPITYHFEKKQ